MKKIVFVSLLLSILSFSVFAKSKIAIVNGYLNIPLPNKTSLDIKDYNKKGAQKLIKSQQFEFQDLYDVVDEDSSIMFHFDNFTADFAVPVISDDQISGHCSVLYSNEIMSANQMGMIFIYNEGFVSSDWVFSVDKSITSEEEKESEINSGIYFNKDFFLNTPEAELVKTKNGYEIHCEDAKYIWSNAYGDKAEFSVGPVTVDQRYKLTMNPGTLQIDLIGDKESVLHATGYDFTQKFNKSKKAYDTVFAMSGKFELNQYNISITTTSSDCIFKTHNIPDSARIDWAPVNVKQIYTINLNQRVYTANTVKESNYDQTVVKFQNMAFIFKDAELFMGETTINISNKDNPRLIPVKTYNSYDNPIPVSIIKEKDGLIYGYGKGNSYNDYYERFTLEVFMNPGQKNSSSLLFDEVTLEGDSYYAYGLFYDRRKSPEVVLGKCHFTYENAFINLSGIIFKGVDIFLPDSFESEPLYLRNLIYNAEKGLYYNGTTFALGNFLNLGSARISNIEFTDSSIILKDGNIELTDFLFTSNQRFKFNKIEIDSEGKIVEFDTEPVYGEGIQIDSRSTISFQELYLQYGSQGFILVGVNGNLYKNNNYYTIPSVTWNLTKDTCSVNFAAF